jgi:hypothetical protein
VAGRGLREYRISAVFRAPLRFAYNWCTDYIAGDPAIAGEYGAYGLQRRIILRSWNRAVFENLHDHGQGWAWERPL